MRKSEHFSLSTLADFARGACDERSRREIGEHLTAGCARCSREAALFGQVAAVAAAERSASPAEGSVRIAKTLFVTREPAPLHGLRKLQLQLTAGGALAPAYGLRAGELEPRLETYASDEGFVLSLKLEAAEGSPSGLEGEILRRRAGPVAGAPVLLLAGDRVARRTTSDALGQFSLDAGGAGPAPRLVLLLEDDTCIDLPL